MSEMTGCEGPGPALGSRLCWEAPGAKQMGTSGRGSPAVWRLPFCCGFQLGLGFSPFLFVFSVDLRHCRRGAGLHCHRQLPPQEGLGVWPVQLVLPWLDLRGGGLAPATKWQTSWDLQRIKLVLKQVCVFKEQFSSVNLSFL